VRLDYLSGEFFPGFAAREIFRRSLSNGWKLLTTPSIIEETLDTHDFGPLTGGAFLWASDLKTGRVFRE